MTHTNINDFAAELVRRVEETAEQSTTWLRYVVLDRLAPLVKRYTETHGDTALDSQRVAECFLNGMAVHWKTGAFYQQSFGFSPEAGLGEDYDSCFVPDAVDAGELIAEGVGFDMRADESSFREDGELRGIRAFDTDTAGEMREPLTFLEAAWFCRQVWGSNDAVMQAVERIATDPEHGECNTRTAIANRALKMAVEDFEDHRQAIEAENLVRQLGTPIRRKHRDDDYARAESEEKPLSALAVLMFDADGNMLATREQALDLLQRAKASARRENVGEAWSYTDRYCFGMREAITHDQTHQNEANIRRLDQDHMPGERVDGQLLPHEAEAEATERVNLIFRSMYGVRDSEGNEVLAADGGPANKLWSSYHGYIRRCAHSREMRFARLAKYLLTQPLEKAKAALAVIDRKYIESIKSAAPGPGRGKIDGKWRNMPLAGPAALEWLRKQPGAEKLRRGIKPGLRVAVSKSLTVAVGEAWHKTILKREHIDALETLVVEREQHIELLRKQYQ